MLSKLGDFAEGFLLEHFEQMDERGDSGDVFFERFDAHRAGLEVSVDPACEGTFLLADWVVRELAVI